MPRHMICARRTEVEKNSGQGMRFCSFPCTGKEVLSYHIRKKIAMEEYVLSE